MAKKQDTRERILDVAEKSILEKGFDATSIEEIITAINISKGGFFYHFPDKNALAHALLIRYIEIENQLFDDIFGRAKELDDDPYHTMLIGLKMLAELLDDLPNGHPGCLIASVCYQDRLFDPLVKELYTNALLTWRSRFRTMFEDIVIAYPANEDVNLDHLADMLSGVVEGGIILARALNCPHAVATQILQFRLYIKLLFSPNQKKSSPS